MSGRRSPAAVLLPGLEGVSAAGRSKDTTLRADFFTGLVSLIHSVATGMALGTQDANAPMQISARMETGVFK